MHFGGFALLELKTIEFTAFQTIAVAIRAPSGTVTPLLNAILIASPVAIRAPSGTVTHLSAEHSI